MKLIGVTVTLLGLPNFMSPFRASTLPYKIHGSQIINKCLPLLAK